MSSLAGRFDFFAVGFLAAAVLGAALFFGAGFVGAASFASATGASWLTLLFLAFSPVFASDFFLDISILGVAFMPSCRKSCETHEKISF